jgi:hypothetical protein
MEKQTDTLTLLCGRYFSAQELEDLQETVRMFPKLSRAELASTLCEILDWVTPTGQYKMDSCHQLLEKLAGQGLITLPNKRKCKSYAKKVINFTSRTAAGPLTKVQLGNLGPIHLEPIREQADIRLWNEYVHRYHTLGYKRPFGAHQRYFIITETSQKPLGCLLFAAAAWALEARDTWIGWTEVDRSLRLNLVVNNTRFLIFPWVQVKNLASKALSLAVKQIGFDWQARYGYSPVLLETFVDPEKYRGTCYQAANWTLLGRTKGRGRMDRYNEKAFTRKQIYVYPLRRDFRAILCGESEIK